jgi:hypothetical protein
MPGYLLDARLPDAYEGNGAGLTNRVWSLRDVLMGSVLHGLFMSLNPQPKFVPIDKQTDGNKNSVEYAGNRIGDLRPTE